jgi:hypothetical protein
MRSHCLVKEMRIGVRERLIVVAGCGVGTSESCSPLRRHVFRLHCMGTVVLAYIHRLLMKPRVVRLKDKLGASRGLT